MTTPPRPVLWRQVPRGRALLFAPHPDDEVAGPGGILCLHRRQGDAVRVVVATDGSNGDPDGRHDPTAYAALRRDESRRGLQELDVDDVVFWGFPDGCELSEADLERGVQLAAQTLRDFAPDVVYLPWRLEGHPDHHALYVIVTLALERVAFAGLALGYEVWNAMIPDVIVDVTAVVEPKRRAMLAHASQLAYVQYDHSLLGLSAYRALVHLRGRGYGEALQLVRGTLPPQLADPDA
ncbi:MAG: PIG-L family deacetylase [Planctomycetes bacterium]|nr:PIG-L family deacetylase [Planctomycetota bacterium]